MSVEATCFNCPALWYRKVWTTLWREDKIVMTQVCHGFDDIISAVIWTAMVILQGGPGRWHPLVTSASVLRGLDLEDCQDETSVETLLLGAPGPLQNLLDLHIRMTAAAGRQRSARHRRDSVGAASLAAVCRQCPALERFSLQLSRSTPNLLRYPAFEAMQGHALQQLFLEGHSFSPDAILSLRHLPSLQQLDVCLHGGGAQEVGSLHLAGLQLPQLRHCGVFCEAMEHLVCYAPLFHLTRLTSLSLATVTAASGNEHPEEDAAAAWALLAGLSHLRSLLVADDFDAEDAMASDAAFKAACQALPLLEFE